MKGLLRAPYHSFRSTNGYASLLIRVRFPFVGVCIERLRAYFGAPRHVEWLTTSTILQRLHDFDDRAVWDRFAGRFRRPLAAFARKLGLSPSEADDVVQEILLTFARAYSRGKYDREKGRLSHWLFGIAYRQIANLRRRRARENAQRDHRGAMTEFWETVPAEDEASKVWDAEWEKSLLDACLRQARREVSENTYRAFELVVRGGASPDEVAQQLSMTRNGVYVAKHRVLKRLEELMKDYEDPSPGA